MKQSILILTLFFSAWPQALLAEQTDLQTLRQEMHEMQSLYEKRIQELEDRYKAQMKALEQRIQAAETTPPPTPDATGSRQAVVAPQQQTAANSFNPAISLILNGRYANFSNDPHEYELPGFTLSGEAGLGKEGLSVEHTELAFSANVDDKFFGKLTAALASHDGSTEVEMEEAYIETLGLGHGLNLRAGRFFSAIGYLNEQHEHAWDFSDAPLIYRGLFGNQLNDDGLQASWLAPTDLYLQVGGELLRGDDFPAAGGAHDGVGAYTLFTRIGGDVGTSHSWQAGISYWSADVEDRTGETHSHGGEESAETPSFTGDSNITAFNFVWKWAPEGNSTQQNLKLQFEYFNRNEDGSIVMDGSSPLETTSYDGDQKGWYAQAVYQFMPQWRAGLRYDHLDVDNNGSDYDILEESGLSDEGHNPERFSIMTDWANSEFSWIRLQYNHDKSYSDSDEQFILQYVHSLGSHGAHQF
ncbi:MAG: OprO/OprP family phosphate-selective porin [Desulfobulbaceae bacterium]|nr:OprO/OprP family phosphate-selective porin [Desulfobulbaceae bacterium]